MLAFLVPKPAAKPSQAPPEQQAAPGPPSAAPEPPESAPEPPEAAPDELILDRIVAEEVRLGSLHYRVAWQGANPDSWIRADDEAWTDGSTTDVLQVWQAAKAAAAVKAEPKAAAKAKAAPKAASAKPPVTEAAALPTKAALPVTLAEKVGRIRTELTLSLSLSLSLTLTLTLSPSQPRAGGAHQDGARPRRRPHARAGGARGAGGARPRAGGHARRAGGDPNPNG